LGNRGHKRVQSTFLEEHFAARLRGALGQLLQLDSPDQTYSPPKQPVKSASMHDGNPNWDRQRMSRSSLFVKSRTWSNDRLY
jgi:hypothetical protein